MARAVTAPRCHIEVRAPDRTQHLVMIDDPVADDVDIHLRQPNGTSNQVKGLVEAEADRRTPQRAPKF